MRPARLALPLAIMVIVAVGIWVHFLLEDLAPPQPPDPERPDYIVRDLRIIEMTSEGVPGRIVEAKSLRHYSGLDATEAEHPILTIFHEGAENWRVRSESGRILHSDDEILLEGEVQIDRSAVGNIEPLRILTRNLRVLNQGTYAETPHETRIESIRHQVKGTGMKAWLEAPVRVKLLAQVQGHHELD